MRMQVCILPTKLVAPHHTVVASREPELLLEDPETFLDAGIEKADLVAIRHLSRVAPGKIDRRRNRAAILRPDRLGYRRQTGKRLAQHPVRALRSAVLAIAIPALIAHLPTVPTDTVPDCPEHYACDPP